MNSRTLLRLAVLLACATFPAHAADPPMLVNYQGVLRDASDRPLNGTYDMVFRFVASPSGGTLLLTDYHTGPNAVALSSGLFSTMLGGGTLAPGTEASLLDVFTRYSPVWVEVQVGSETLSPRVQVVSAAYAINAGRVGGQPAGDFLDKGPIAQVKSGALTVNGGLVGQANAPTGDVRGVYGLTMSNEGVGVLGSALASNGPTEGVRGQSTSPDGKGVVGGAFSATGLNFGVYGETASTNGTGTYGRASATSGYTTGVGGETYSPYGTGVAGVAHAAGGDAWGVYGATESPTGWGIVAEGGLAVSGDLYVTGAKSFVSEHPGLADRMIRYACLEGGEVGVYHRGTARLAAGEARVDLPDSFSLVATGRITVQVTPLEPSGTLFVPEATVSANGFTVREAGGARSGAAFSWVVMAEREGFAGFDPVQPVSASTKLLISRKFTPAQKAALRRSLPAGELDGASRASLYASLQRGDAEGACRAVGGCDRPAEVPAPGPTPNRDAAPPGPTLPAFPVELHAVAEAVEPGDVVVVDREGSIRLGGVAGDPGVLGVVAEGTAVGGRTPIALAGTTLCKVDASLGAIAPGDLLVVAPTPGHAMRVPEAKPGTIVGKALEGLESGTGTIRVLVTIR